MVPDTHKSYGSSMSRPLYTQPSVEGAAIEKLISGEQHHKIQRRISEQLWK